MADLKSLIFHAEATLQSFPSDPKNGIGEDEEAARSLAERHGATYRFSAGTHLFRMGGVAVTSTQGFRGAVEYWVRRARVTLRESRKGAT